MNETIKLKKCPFCGRRPSLAKGKREAKDFVFGTQIIRKAGDWIWMPAISCRPCDIKRVFETPEEAAEWWNTRA
jgi:hypothetical protein